jgi:hypothetical protein
LLERGDVEGVPALGRRRGCQLVEVALQKQGELGVREAGALDAERHEGQSASARKVALFSVHGMKSALRRLVRNT